MTNPLPLPDEIWSQVPPDAQAVIAALFLSMRQRTGDLENRVADLEARLKLNSTNSHKPPSSDFIGAKRKPPSPPTGKKRGGQPEHRKAHRELVPPEKLRETFTCKPTTCRRCGRGLLGDDPTPLIHQVAELPKVGWCPGRHFLSGGGQVRTVSAVDDKTVSGPETLENKPQCALPGVNFVRQTVRTVHLPVRDH